MKRKLLGKIILAVFALGGIAGTLQTAFSEMYVNPALPLYILVMVCATGFLILADKK